MSTNEADENWEKQSGGESKSTPVVSSTDRDSLKPKKQRFPILTWLTSAASVLIFIGLADENNSDSWEALAKWGCYPPDRLREGALWGLITSNLVHQQLWHLAFNLYWLYHLGSRLEMAIGSGLWLLFFLGASLVSSGYQLAVSDSTGLGMSGVVYAMFGFMWLTRSRYAGFADTLDSKTSVIFVLWLVGCIFASAFGGAPIGNAAHVAGLLFGALCAGTVISPPRWRPTIAISVSVFTLGSILVVFWAPWSSGWTSWRALRAHGKADYKTAIHLYDRAEKLGYNKDWCLMNKALAYWSLGDTSSYRNTLSSLRHLNREFAETLEKGLASTNAPAQSQKSRETEWNP